MSPQRPCLLQIASGAGLQRGRSGNHALQRDIALADQANACRFAAQLTAAAHAAGIDL
ncbi:hypothetical protein FHY13_003778 [Xanthomonas arboricola]|nr:hypothetical protein [Xanthomonas euroxanthea]